jgi:hypothetical protein
MVLISETLHVQEKNLSRGLTRMARGGGLSDQGLTGARLPAEDCLTSKGLEVNAGI